MRWGVWAEPTETNKVGDPGWLTDSYDNRCEYPAKEDADAACKYEAELCKEYWLYESRLLPT